MSAARLLLMSAFCIVISCNAMSQTSDQKPLEILLVTGGCCHDYDYQSKAMQLAFKKRGVPTKWTVVNKGGKGTKAEIELYQNPDWAKGFDVVIHNECFANTDNAEYIRKITKPHYEGVNAVVIHCAMHSYRAAKIDDWREFLGVTSRRHEHQSNYEVKVVAKDHAIMAGYPDGKKSAKDELYVIEKLWPNTKVLAISKSERNDKEHAVFWTNKYGKGRVFGTTYGHSNATFEDEAFLDTLVRGSVWAAKGKVAMKPSKPVAIQGKAKWVALAGKWKKCEFGGDGEIEMSDKMIKLGMGDPITGVYWDGKGKDAVPTDNYEIEVEGRRTEGFDFFCAITFPIEKSHASLVMGGWGGGIFGISSIDDRDASDNNTTMFMDFDNNQWYRARIRVEESRIAVWLDDQLKFEHERKGHKFDIRYEMDPCTPFGLANYQCKSEIRSVRIRKLDKSELGEELSSKKEPVSEK